MICNDDSFVDLYWDYIEEIAESKCKHNLYVIDIVYENKNDNTCITDSYECYYKHDEQAKEYANNLFERLKQDNDIGIYENLVPIYFIVLKYCCTEFGTELFEEIY